MCSHIEKNDFYALETLLREPGITSFVTFGGTRVIRFANGEQEPLNGLIEAMSRASWSTSQCQVDGCFVVGRSLVQRVHMLNILQELTRHLKDTSEKIQKGSCLTWFFNLIKEWWSNALRSHRHLETGIMAGNVLLFTRHDVGRLFGKDHPSIRIERPFLEKGDSADFAMENSFVTIPEDELRKAAASSELEIEERLCDLERRSESLLQRQENLAEALA